MDKNKQVNFLDEIIIDSFAGGGGEKQKGSAADAPLGTVTAIDHNAVVMNGADMLYWPQVRELLNKYAEYTIADNEVLIFEIDGIRYFIGDIEMRMLLPRELYGCQGFPPDYIIDRGRDNKPYPIAEQVKKVGNSVCPPVAMALVAANLAELACKIILTTMAELNKKIAI